MTSIITCIKLGVAAGVMLSAVAGAPVYAISGPSADSDSSVSSEDAPRERQRDRTRSSDDDTDGADAPDDSDGRVRISNSGPGSFHELRTDNRATVAISPDSVKSEARKLLEDKRKNASEKTLAKRQAACERRQAAVNKKFTAFDAAANRHLTRLDVTFAKLKDYQTTQKLNAPNFDALVITATAKQSAATQSVTVLKTLTAQIDCSAEDPAASVASSKAAVTTSRTALQEYRKSIKNILVELMKAKGDDSTGADSPKEGAN